MVYFIWSSLSLSDMMKVQSTTSTLNNNNNSYTIISWQSDTRAIGKKERG